MNKKSAHNFWVKLRVISSWYFAFGLVFSGFVAGLALRHNNTTALYLRDQVNIADKANGDTELALHNLRAYMYSHMNTSLSDGPNAIKPPIQLKYRYERLLAAQNAVPNNSTVYNDAQNYCEKTQPQGFFGATRLTCVQSYITSHGQKPVEVKPIPDALYKFDFSSPLWSPDLAGWSLVLTALFGLLLIVRLSLEYWLHRYIKSRR